MGKQVTLDEVLPLARELTAVDQIRLIEQLTPSIRQKLAGGQQTPRRSLRGLWRGLSIEPEEIAELRREMWRGFSQRPLCHRIANE